MPVRPFRFYGHGELQALQSRLDRLIRDWSMQCFNVEIEFLSSVERPAPAPKGLQWFLASMNEKQKLWYGLSDHFARQLAQQAGWAARSKAQSPLWESLFTDALEHLFRAILGHETTRDESESGLQMSSAKWERDWESEGAGFLLFRLAIGVEILYVGLPVESVERLIGEARPVAKAVLSDRVEGIQQAKLPIEVCAGVAEISVSDLVQFSVGNILVLDTPIGGPLEIRRVEDRQRIGRGYLAAKSGFKVMQMARKDL